MKLYDQLTPGERSAVAALLGFNDDTSSGFNNYLREIDALPPSFKLADAAEAYLAYVDGKIKRNTARLSFDGKGINAPDQYRTRIAGFSSSEAAAQYGPLFAAAPDLLELAKQSAHLLAEASTSRETEVIRHRSRLVAAIKTLDPAYYGGD